jgi:pyroglutamyl-peptidase
MSLTMLLTGFGPFPGAPDNPSGPLVMRLAQSRRPALAAVRRIPHVFETTYRAVDAEWPALLRSLRPDIVLMFGLASEATHLRVEMRAQTALSAATPDASGQTPRRAAIKRGARPTLPMPAPALRLAAAARLAGLPTVPSRDAGRYLCNYLCWQAVLATQQSQGPRVAAFVQVPPIDGSVGRRFTPDDLLLAGERIAMAILEAAR